MTENQTIDHIDFTCQPWEEEYYHCTFVACNFSQQVLREADFDNCTFRACDFSLAKFKDALRDVSFVECKLMGADFTELPRLSHGVSFVQSQLDYANFTGVKLPKTVFTDCRLYESFFDEADLTASRFDRCDLERASFFGANLKKVDFSTASHFAINPATCKLKQAVFAESDLRGLVAHLNIVIK